MGPICCNGSGLVAYMPQIAVWARTKERSVPTSAATGASVPRRPAPGNLVFWVQRLLLQRLLAHTFVLFFKSSLFSQTGKQQECHITPFTNMQVAVFGKQTPIGRPGQPKEFGPVAVFLATEADSSYIVGAIVGVTGGGLIN